MKEGMDKKRAAGTRRLGMRCPLIPLWPDKNGIGGYMFPMKNGTGVGVMLDIFTAPNILDERSHVGWDDAYYTLLKNYQDNSKWLDPQAPEPKPKNAKALISSVKDPDRTAVITSCGPSLSRNFTYLYEARRRGMNIDIYGINRSARAIRPDGLCLIERRREPEWIEDRMGAPGFALALFNTAPETLQHYLRKNVPIYWGRGCMSTEIEAQDPREAAYPMMSVKGGTTLSCLLYFLVQMGYRRILLTGCDMAIETEFDEKQGNAFAKRMYFDRFFADTNYKLRPQYSGKSMMAIEGITGECVMVNNELMHFAGYIQAFEQLAWENLGVEIINCSEGGALWLPNMMPLREALGIEELDASRQKYNAMFAIDRYSDRSFGGEALNEVLDAMKRHDVGQIVDMGCGCGNLTNGLARERPDGDFYGVDISDVAIETATEVASRLSLSNAKFHLVFDDYSIPQNGKAGVTCYDVLEHLADADEVEQYFKNLAVSKPIFIKGAVMIGKAGFVPAPAGDLHTCLLRSGEWATLLDSLAQKHGYKVKNDIDGRRVSFEFSFGAEGGVS